MDPWKNIKNLSQQEVRRLQDAKLYSFINHYVYPFSPHYRKLFDQHKIDPRKIRSVADLKAIPLSDKSDFVGPKIDENKYKEFVLQPDKDMIKAAWKGPKLLKLLADKLLKGAEFVDDKLSEEFRPVFMTFTTGTTSQPVPFLYTNYDIENLRTSGSRMVNLFEVAPQERIANLFPYAPHLAFWQVVFGGFEAHVLVLSTGGGKTIGTEGNIKALMKMKPAVIMGVPSYVYHIFRSALEMGLKMDFVKKVVLGASKCSVDYKLKLAEILEGLGAKGFSIFGTYGFTEARCAWAESPSPLDKSSGYHLYPDKEIFEVVDPKTGEVKKEGEDGELVYTGLDARGSVVLRYRTGDFVKGGITFEPTSYSRLRVPRIANDISRLSDIKDFQLSKVKGTLVDFGNFASLFAEIKSVDEWQIEVRKKNNDPFDMDEMVVYVTSNKNGNEEKLKEDIKAKMVSSMEIRPNEVIVVKMEDMVKRLDLEGNKAKRILDNRPKG